MDYISMCIEGECVSVPIRKGKTYTFEMSNVRGTERTDFHVVVRDEAPIDINQGDRVLIANAGFFSRDGINCLAVVENSTIKVIRKRCNLGDELV